MSSTTETQNKDTVASTAATQAATPEEEGHRVYVGNLAFAATEAEVREHFTKVGGEILSVILPTRFKSRRPAGYAFVTFKDEADANKAVDTLNETEIGDRKIQLQVARSKEENAERKADILAKRKEATDAKRKANAEAKAAAKATKDAEKTDSSAQAGGDTTAVDSDKSTSKATKAKKKKASKNSGRRRGPDDDEDTAVEDDKESDSKAPKKKKAPKEARIDGGEEDKEGAKAKKEPKERKPRLQLTGENSKNTVFVANLPFTVDDEKLAELFSNLSIKVKSAHVIKGIRRLPGRRPFRGSKGFGFVELEDPSQQDEAVEKINGSNIGDRKVTAKVAQEMKPIEEIQAEQDKKDKDEAAAASGSATPAAPAAAAKEAKEVKEEAPAAAAAATTPAATTTATPAASFATAA